MFLLLANILLIYNICYFTSTKTKFLKQDFFVFNTICDTVLYNKNYIFGLHDSWHIAPKTLVISYTRTTGVFSFIPSSLNSSRAPPQKNVKQVSFVIHNKPLLITHEFILMRRLLESSKGWGIVAKDTNSVISGFELLAPLLRIPGRQRG